MRNLSANVQYSNRETHKGEVQNENFWVGGGFELRQAQIAVNLSYSDGLYRSSTGRGTFSNTVYDDHYWALTMDFNTRSSRLGYGFYHADGELSGDDYRYTSGYLWINPTVDTYLNYSREILKNYGAYRQQTLQASWDITVEDGLVARLIDADEGMYRRLAYRRTVASGVDVFAVYDDEPYSDWQLSVKLVWVYSF